MKKKTIAALSGTMLWLSPIVADEAGVARLLGDIDTRINCGTYEIGLTPEHFKRLGRTIGRLEARTAEFLEAAELLAQLDGNWIEAVVGCIKEDPESCSNITHLPRELQRAENAVKQLFAVQHQLRLQIFSEPSRVAMRACAQPPAKNR
ncbi:MAG: hypothetical protein U9Q71_06285 [Pseudomonadota bacterium]|nr:hypothetical protein [Pseudomonadota bacterium]